MPTYCYLGQKSSPSLPPPLGSDAFEIPNNMIYVLYPSSRFNVKLAEKDTINELIQVYRTIEREIRTMPSCVINGYVFLSMLIWSQVFLGKENNQ